MGGRDRARAAHSTRPCRLVHAVALSRDGRFAISASMDKTLKIWEVDSGGELRTLSGHSSNVYGVASSGDGKRLVSSSWDETLKVWEFDSGHELLP